MTNMIVKLNNLTESLDRKLQESVPLTERFNDSFPDWLKRRIVVTKDSLDWQKAKNIPYEDRPSYINARDEKYSNTLNRSLFQKALNAGINFEKTKVIEGPIPEKRTDERLKEPNIPIWYFSNGDSNSSGQVYIEGLNDSEIFNATQRAFKYMPMKEKLAYAKGFAYIDGNTLDPEAYRNLLADRKKLASELKDIPNYTRYGTEDYDKFSRGKSWKSTVDKSGYIVDPERYEKEIKKFLGKKIYKELENMYNYISDARTKALDAYSQMDPFESDESDRNGMKAILSHIDDAARSYNRYMNKIQETLNNTYYDEEDKQRVFGNMVREIRGDSSIKYIKDLGSELFLKDIDWD